MGLIRRRDEVVVERRFRPGDRIRITNGSSKGKRGKIVSDWHDIRHLRNYLVSLNGELGTRVLREDYLEIASESTS